MQGQSKEQLVETGKTLQRFVHFLSATVSHEGGGVREMMGLLAEIVERAGDDDLYGRYYVSKFIYDHDVVEMKDAEALSAKAVQHFRNAENSTGEGVSASFLIASKSSLTRPKAAFYNSLAAYYHARSQLPRAWECAEQARTLAAVESDALQECIAVHWMAELHYRRGEYTLGVTRGAEGRLLAQRAGNFPLEADCVRAQALSCIALGNFTCGATLCADARRLLVACGLGDGDTGLRIMNLEAEILYQKGEFAGSLAIHRAYAGLTSATVRPVDHAYALVNIAGIEIIMGAPDEKVLQSLDGARELFVGAKYPRGVCNCDVVLADLYYRQGKLTDAKALYSKCLRIAHGRDAEIPILCLEKLGDIFHDLQDILGTL
jgi:tetratricopeptide (TPR) repeat protein